METWQSILFLTLLLAPLLLVTGHVGALFADSSLPPNVEPVGVDSPLLALGALLVCCLGLDFAAEAEVAAPHSARWPSRTCTTTKTTTRTRTHRRASRGEGYRGTASDISRLAHSAWNFAAWFVLIGAELPQSIAALYRRVGTSSCTSATVSASVHPVGVEHRRGGAGLGRGPRLRRGGGERSKALYGLELQLLLAAWWACGSCERARGGVRPPVRCRALFAGFRTLLHFALAARLLSELLLPANFPLAFHAVLAATVTTILSLAVALTCTRSAASGALRENASKLTERGLLSAAVVRGAAPGTRPRFAALPALPAPRDRPHAAAVPSARAQRPCPPLPP